jgi:cytochrome o ubiquinol oxidase subunit III
MSSDSHAAHLHHQNEMDSIDVFGFWLYIMTDCILFAALFAAFLVLHHPGVYGPDFKKFIELPYVLGETFFLLASNFVFGLAVLALYKNKVSLTRIFLTCTFILGAGFVFMEIAEFIKLFHEGYTPQTSGGASAFFVLVGTHGFHVSMGLLWILMMIIQLPKLGASHIARRRMAYLGMFWNFLDIVWIFLFTLVYLMGAM